MFLEILFRGEKNNLFFHFFASPLSPSSFQTRRLFKKKQVIDVRTWGHVGHLDASQEEALKQFKAQVADVFDPTVDDDYRCLQFLRARKFEVAKTVTLWREMKAWRRSFGTDSILLDPPPHADLISRLRPNAHHKFDKLGRPIYIELLGYQDMKKLTVTHGIPFEELVRFHVFSLERQREVMAMATARFGTRIGTVVSILDLNAASMKRNMHKTAREFAKEIAAIGQMYYPESLGKMFIINAPTAFGAAWNFIKPFLDPRTVNKIEVVRGNPGPRLLEFIDADCLPAFLGGSCSCAGGCVPVDAAAVGGGEVVADDGEDPEKELGGLAGGEESFPTGGDDYAEEISDVGSPAAR